MMSLPLCDDCDFWDPPANTPAAIPDSGVLRSGFCHRFPETLRKRADEWCGEHSGLTSIPPATPDKRRK